MLFAMYKFRKYGLGAFNVKAAEASSQEVAAIGAKNSSLGRETSRCFLPEVTSYPDDVYLRGDWQCEKL